MDKFLGKYGYRTASILIDRANMLLVDNFPVDSSQAKLAEALRELRDDLEAALRSIEGKQL